MDNIAEIAVEWKTLPRFVEKHCDEYTDWLKVLKEKCVFSSFAVLTKQLINLKIIDELQLVYIGFMYEEMRQSDADMQKVIKWQLEDQFHSLPPQTNILNSIRNEIEKFKEQYKTHSIQMKHSLEPSSTVIDKLLCICHCEMKTKDIFMNVPVTQKCCPIAIYNNNVKCFQDYYEYVLPVNMEKDCCYILYNKTWIKCRDKKIEFRIKRHQYITGFVLEFLDWFTVTFSKINIVKTLYYGFFIFPSLHLDVISFLDHILLDKNLHYIVLDEHNLTQKKWLTLRFKLDEMTTVVCNVNRKQVEKNSKIALFFDNKKCPVDSEYTKVSFFSIEDLLQIETLKAKISKVFYYTQNSSVKEYYYKILPAIESEQTTKPLTNVSFDTTENVESRNKMLKILVPELFLINYPRKCLHLPRILNDDEPREYAMRFPIHGEPTETRWYGCDHHEKAKYPGLRANPLKNSKEFPVIPCCYISDQRDKQGSEYRKYYMNDSQKKRKKVNENIVYSTNRIVPENMTGLVPKKLQFIFWDKKFTFQRMGVARSPFSAIHCCAIATGLPYQTIDTDSDHVKLFCSQESHEDDRERPTYFDVKKYYRLLEELYDINIVLFENERDTTTLSLVNKQKCYYCNFAWRPRTLFMLINFGLEADTYDWPQCEIICSIDSLSNAVYVFSDKIAEKILTLFDCFNNTMRIERCCKPRHQIINDDGLAVFIYEDDTPRLCDPMHPMYWNVPFSKPEKPKDNIMLHFSNRMEQFESDFKLALENNASCDEVIDNVVKSLSERGKDYLKNRGHFLNISNDWKDEMNARRFHSLEAYKEFCKYKKCFKLTHPRLKNNVLYLESFDKSTLLQFVENKISFKIHSFSLENDNYFEEFIYLDGKDEYIVHYDDNWFKSRKVNDGDWNTNDRSSHQY
jgi:hypothetical protein